MVRSFRLGSVEGRLLHFALRGFYEALKRGEADAADIAAVVETVLHGNARMSRDARFKVARDRAIRLFAREATVDTRLDAETLARRFGVSRATVYRAFRDHGGLERFRMKARLDRAHDALAGREPPRGEISRLASGFGFSSTAHFSDAFLQRFGVRPSQGARLSRRDASPAGAPVNNPRDLEATMRRITELYARMTG